MLEANQDRLNWKLLSINPAAIHLLEANLDKIDWDFLSTNSAAIHLLEANPDKIDWAELSENPAAIHLLEANQNKIEWWTLSVNPGIFTYDYDLMMQERKQIRYGLIEYLHQPRFIEQWLNTGNDIEDYLM